MAEKITTKKFASNVIISLAAQIISMAVSFVTALIVPRFIDVYQYASWQIYVLYAGYVGVLHFGLLDGLVLRYSKYDYDELDKERLRSQFKILLLFTCALTTVVTIVSATVLGGDYKLIFIFVGIAIVTKNLVTYGSYMFQITNRINKYAVMIIAQRLAYGLIVVALLLFGVKDFYWYCAADLCGDAVGMGIGFIFNKGLYFQKALGLKEAFKELKINVASGIILMLANWSAALMVGSAKMITQWRWNELVFGKVSFAFSISNIFLSFVTAISVVMFPSLKRADEEKLPEMYGQIRKILSFILFFAMLFYFAGCWILNKWIPKYSVSLTYLGILLPIIIYSSKVSLLTNNYLKVYRKEKAMMVVNLVSIAIGVIAFLLSAYVFNSLNAVLISVVIVVMLNSILAEICVLKTIRVRIVADFIVEAFMTAGFILCARLLNLWLGCLVYLGIFAVYCVINRKAVSAVLGRIFKRKKEEKETE
ncbi:lipopolysaccharide biosynthesis protein [Pumilibacter muris]|uniref:lipopolysaccharide biosynthesis protein n=1 Tax=Pumilibacter muris TaxID=2941510 RepID=UPI00204050AB|nr:hypothetical protein [Pumilibacter muris]